MARPRVRVCARIRPSSDSSVTAVAPDRVRVQLPYGERLYPLDAVLGPEATQEDAFAIAEPLVDGVAQGTDATLMCYGHTSAGKTYTMGLLEGCTEGLVLCAFRRLFEQVGERGSVRLSFLQLHKDRVQDLLCPDSKQPLQIREVATAGGLRNSTIVVEHLTQVPVRCLAEAAEVTQLAARQRVEGVRRDATLSSRAHLVVMAYVVGLEADAHAPLAQGTLTRLLMVDLAGSERSATIFPTAGEDRLQESKAINASLSALGKVIIALSAGKSHVPYRDSVLTRVLQDGLGRGASVCLVACVHSGAQYTQETIATLQFALRCRRIEPCAGSWRSAEQPWQHLGRFAGASRLQASLARFAADCCAAEDPDEALLQLSDAVDTASAELRCASPRGRRTPCGGTPRGSTPRGGTPRGDRVGLLRGAVSPASSRPAYRESESPKRSPCLSPQSIRLRPRRKDEESASVSTAACSAPSARNSLGSSLGTGPSDAARSTERPHGSAPDCAPARGPGSPRRSWQPPSRAHVWAGWPR